jgi:hypothetical protein
LQIDFFSRIMPQGLSRNGSKNMTVNSVYCSGLPSHQISIQLCICERRRKELFGVEIYSQPTWHNCGKHWSQHGPESLGMLSTPWTVYAPTNWGCSEDKLNIRKVFLMFCTLSVCCLCQYLYSRSEQNTYWQGLHWSVKRLTFYNAPFPLHSSHSEKL